MIIFISLSDQDKYPSGEMTKEEFVAFTLEKDDTADEDIASSLFEIFDKDASGAMDFSEFIMASQVSKVSSKFYISSVHSFKFSASDARGKTQLDI